MSESAGFGKKFLLLMRTNIFGHPLYDLFFTITITILRQDEFSGPGHAFRKWRVRRGCDAM